MNYLSLLLSGLGLVAISTSLPTTPALFLSFMGGHFINWVPITSQGNIADTPPPFKDTSPSSWPVSQLQDRHYDHPDGAVPIFLSLDSKLSTVPVPDTTEPLTNEVVTIQENKETWNAATGPFEPNLIVHGASARISMYDPYVRPSDMSAIEITLSRSGVPGVKGTGEQVIKAGWMKNPSLFGDRDDPKPHLFTYFSANGDDQLGDDVGSWNRDYRGWVQVSDTVYPGCTFKTLSVLGGAGFDILLSFHLIDGNWWLFVKDHYMGYFPGELFSKGRNAEDSLASHAENILFSGSVTEIETGATDLPPTAMGSGQYPDAGFDKVAYIRNMKMLAGGDEDWKDVYNSLTFMDDEERYQIRQGETDSMTALWGSHVFVGGPGKLINT